MANKLSIDIAVLLKGAEQINKLADSLNKLKAASGGTPTVKVPSLKQPIDETERLNKSILNAARAMATFQSASGNLAAAQNTLQSAINKVGKESQVTLGAQTQLARVQNALRLEGERNERTIAAQALLRARNRQSLGDEAGAVNILKQSIARLTPETAAAYRAQKLLNDISNGYSNSPLIGAIQQVSRGLGFLSPVLGRTGGALQSIVGVAGQAAQQFSNTGKASEAASKGASQFANFLNSARGAAQSFAKDQGGSASLTDFLLNLSKAASNAGERIRAAFASIREAIRNAFSQVRQGGNPLASLFGGTKATGAADTAKLAASLGEVESAAGGAGEAVAGISTASIGATAALGAVAVAGLSLIGIVTIGKQIVDVLIEIGTAGIAANAGFEQVKIGIASVVASVGKLSQNGVELKGIDALNAALPLAQKQLEALRVDALNTALSFEEISKGFLQAVGPGLAAGLNLDQIRKSVVDISQLVGPLTGQTQQLGQELRAIFSGDINQDSQVAKALQITREQVKAAKEAGTFAEFLNEKLKVASATGAIMAQTFEAAKSNLKEAGTVLAAQVSEGLFTSLKSKINELLPQVFNTAGGKVNIAPAFSGLADTLTAIFDRVGAIAERVITFIIDGIKGISAFLSANQPVIDSILEATQIIGEQIVGIVLDLFKTIGISGDWGSGLDTVSKILKVVAVAIAGIRESMLLVRSAIITVGSAIGFALLAPLQVALRAIAALTSVIPGLGSAMRGISDAVDNTLISLTASVKNNGKVVADTVRNFGKAGREALLDIANAPLAAKFKRSIKGLSAATDTSGISLNPAAPPKDDKAKSKKAAEADAKAILASDEKLQEARLALAKAFSEREIDLSKSESELQTRILEQQLEDRQISLENFYAEKAKLIADDSARERKAIQDQITAQRQRITEISGKEDAQLKLAKNPAQRKKVNNDADAERTKILAQIVDLETKLSTEETKGAAQTEINSRKRIVASRDLRADIEDVSTQLLEVTGQGFEAAAADIDKRFRDLITRAVLEFGESSPQVAAINALKAALKTDNTIRQIEREGSTRQAEFDFARVEIQTQLEQGLIGEIEARKQILAIQKAFAEVERARLDKQIEAQKLLTGAASPEVLKLEVKRKDLDSLGVDPIFRNIRAGLENDLSGAFSEFIANAKFNLEGLKNFATGVLDSFRKAIAKALTDRIDKAIIGPITNKFLDKILGVKTLDPNKIKETVSVDANTASTNANTLALNANTASKSTQSIADQIGGDSAIASPTDAIGADVSSPGSALSNVFDNIKNSIQKFTDKLKGLATGVAGGLKSALGSILSTIGGFLTGLLGGIGGGGGLPSSDLPNFSFAEGGYTGDGAKYQPAGVVHAGEYVIPAQRVSQFGAGFFEAIRQGSFSPAMFGDYLSGLSHISVRARSGAFASGGLAAVEPVATGGSSQPTALRIINVNDPAQAAEFLNSPQGEQVILNRITKSPAKWRAALRV
jgi:hypothetical protein